MTTKVTSEFLHQAIISDHTQVSAADADHLLIHDASDNTLKKALVSTITGSSSSAADDITAGDAAVTISTSAGNITIDNGSSDDDIIFKGTDGGSDITALTLDMSEAGRAIFNEGIANVSGNMRVDVDAVLFLDADTRIDLEDGGSTYGRFQMNSTSSKDFIIQSVQDDKDMLFKGSDGGSTITALTLDMSAGGDAIFGGKIQADGALKFNSNTGTPEFQFFGSGTETGVINLGSSNFIIESKVSDKDIIFKGVDGGSDITALTLDMSENGNAIFNGTVNAGLKFINNAWNASAEGRNRFYFGTNSHTYQQTGDAYYFRNSSDVDIVIFDSSGNAYFDGNVTAYYSDDRLKDKQGKIKNALDKVGQIETFYFTENELAKSLGHTVDKKQVGVSAQSVKEVLPEIVDLAPFDTDHETGESKSGEDYMTVDYAKLTPLLIEAIKEQQEQIETLTAKVKKLEGK